MHFHLINNGFFWNDTEWISLYFDKSFTTSSSRPFPSVTFALLQWIVQRVALNRYFLFDDFHLKLTLIRIKNGKKKDIFFISIFHCECTKTMASWFLSCNIHFERFRTQKNLHTETEICWFNAPYTKNTCTIGQHFGHTNKLLFETFCLVRWPIVVVMMRISKILVLIEICRLKYNSFCGFSIDILNLRATDIAED